MADEASLDAVPISEVRTRLIEWFDEHRRPFPWRESDDPWEILVLEVMSQQTQLARATEPWEAFVDRWPTPQALADEDRATVLSFWSAHRLGYNRRAAHLHRAAHRIVDEFGGTLPSSVEDLQSLPGVGPYTANAVASFAFGTGGPVIDTNVKRILYRAFDVPDDDDAFERAAAILARGDAIGRWNAAIMEVGGVACRKTPDCDGARCPLRRWCSAYRSGDFTAPDVSEQPSFEGSRRQVRGRIVRILGEYDRLELDELGRRVRVDYDPTGSSGRAWLREILRELEDDGLVRLIDGSSEEVTLGE